MCVTTKPNAGGPSRAKLPSKYSPKRGFNLSVAGKGGSHQTSGGHKKGDAAAARAAAAAATAAARATSAVARMSMAAGADALAAAVAVAQAAQAAAAAATASTAKAATAGNVGVEGADLEDDEEEADAQSVEDDEFRTPENDEFPEDREGLAAATAVITSFGSAALPTLSTDPCKPWKRTTTMSAETEDNHAHTIAKVGADSPEIKVSVLQQAAWLAHS